jgi:hypothetical protein
VGTADVRVDQAGALGPLRVGAEALGRPEPQLDGEVVADLPGQRAVLVAAVERDAVLESVADRPVAPSVGVFEYVRLFGEVGSLSVIVVPDGSPSR